MPVVRLEKQAAVGHIILDRPPANSYDKSFLDDLSAAIDEARFDSAIKAIVVEHKLKLPKIAMPLRVLVTGTTHTPSIDATLELVGKTQVLERLDRGL